MAFFVFEKETLKTCKIKKMWSLPAITNISRLPRIQRSQDYLQSIANNPGFLFEADFSLYFVPAWSFKFFILLNRFKNRQFSRCIATTIAFPHDRYFEYSASFLERRYTQYWFMLIPSLCECSASDLCRLRGILNLNCPE